MGTPERGTAFLARQNATNVFTVTCSCDDMRMNPVSWEKTMLIWNIETPHNGPGDSNGDSLTMTPYKFEGNHEKVVHAKYTNYKYTNYRRSSLSIVAVPRQRVLEAQLDRVELELNRNFCNRANSLLTFCSTKKSLPCRY
jgi:hypothetical protein